MAPLTGKLKRMHVQMDKNCKDDESVFKISLYLTTLLYAETYLWYLECLPKEVNEYEI